MAPRKGRKRARKASKKSEPSQPAPPAKRQALAVNSVRSEFTDFRYRIHRIRFYKPEAKAVNVLAYDSETAKLALVRGDFTIEIWNLSFTPCVEGIMLGYPENSVESVVWHKGRLFTSGLHGCIVEYDLVTLEQKYTVTLTTGAAWCMAQDHQKTRLAAGTEDGCVTIYKVTDDGVEFVKNLNKLRGRILCLAWSKDDDLIVTGSADSVAIWSVPTGNLVDRISVGRIQKEKETVVWSIALTSDFTIITGDSCGRTSFWDGRTATLMAAFKVHDGDVLSVCLSEDEKRVWSSGVDPLIGEFAKINDTSIGSEVWTKSTTKSLHTHDVRAIARAKGQLLTGGVDTYLVVSTETSVVKHAPFQRKVVHVAVARQHVLIMYDKELELWQLGSAAVDDGPTGSELPLDRSPTMVARVVARSNCRFCTAALSESGGWMACADAVSSTLYQIHYESDSQLKFEKVRSFTEQMGPAKQLLFTKNECHLVALDHRGAIHVFSLPPILLHTISPDSESTARTYLACMSPRDHLAVADNEQNIVIYDVKYPEIALRLPRTRGLATAMRFHPVTGDLLVIYNDNQIVEYSVDERSYSKWCRDVYLLGGLRLKSKSPVTGIAFDPIKESLFFAYNDHELFVVDRRKATEVVEEGDRQALAVRICSRFKWLALFEQIEGVNEVLIIHVKPEQIAQGLPAPLLQKRFGT